MLHKLDVNKKLRQIKEDTIELADTVLRNRKEKPVCHIITIGHDKASEIYVGRKKKELDELHCVAKHTTFSDEDYLNNKNLMFPLIMDRLNMIMKSKDDGVMVQLPIVSDILTEEQKQIIIDKVSVNKDVDGFSNENLGMVMTNKNVEILPCTVQGILQLIDLYLKENNDQDYLKYSDYRNKKIAVIGRSRIVGMPLINTLIMNNAFVVPLNSKTNYSLEAGSFEDEKEYISGLDIIILATGVHGIFTSHQAEKMSRLNYKPLLVIDVGITRNEDNKIVGDFKIDEKTEENSQLYNNSSVTYTPVPGGVGKFTVANVALNTAKLAMKK